MAGKLLLIPLHGDRHVIIGILAMLLTPFAILAESYRVWRSARPLPGYAIEMPGKKYPVLVTRAQLKEHVTQVMERPLSLLCDAWILVNAELMP